MNKNFKYINGYTEELYSSLFIGLKIAFHDFIKYKTCRTLKVFTIKKYKVNS